MKCETDFSLVHVGIHEKVRVRSLDPIQEEDSIH